MASGRGIRVKRWLELMPRPEVTAHPYLADSVRIDISEITLNLGLVWCTANTFTQTGVILRLSKAAVAIGTVPWAQTRLRRKIALFPGNEAALRGSPSRFSHYRA